MPPAVREALAVDCVTPYVDLAMLTAAIGVPEPISVVLGAGHSHALFLSIRS